MPNTFRVHTGTSRYSKSRGHLPRSYKTKETHSAAYQRLTGSGKDNLLGIGARDKSVAESYPGYTSNARQYLYKVMKMKRRLNSSLDKIIHSPSDFGIRKYVASFRCASRAIRLACKSYIHMDLILILLSHAGTCTAVQQANNSLDCQLIERAR